MKILITTLSNGIRIISEDQKHLETTAVGFWVNAGSRNESKNLNGISHLLEHMAFKGTSKRSAQSIVEEIESVGGYLNAYTSKESTAYYARILKNDLEIAVDIIADILNDSTFSNHELEKEKNVIEQEIGQVKDTPDDIIFDHFYNVAFPEQPIGRSILGDTDQVKQFSRSDLISYMQKEYRGKRIVVSASGKVDHDTLVKLVDERMNNYPSEVNSNLEAANYQGGCFTELKDLEQAHILVGLPSVNYTHNNYFVSQIFSAVLGGGMSSRLFQEVREKKGLCYSIYSFASSYIDSGLFGVYAATGEDGVKELLPAIIEQIKGLIVKVPYNELQKAKSQLKSSLLMSLESASARCENLARQLIIHNKPILHSELINEIDNVDSNMLVDFGENMIFSGKPVIVALGPISQLEKYDKIIENFRSG